MKRTILLCVLSAGFVMALCIGAWGLPGSEHARDWNDTFGIYDGTSQQNIQQLWSTAQQVIDETASDYRELQAKFQWFTWGSYGHRLLFHWGFNADPKKYPQLVRQVHSCLKGRPDAKEQEQKFFAYLTREVQAKRNTKLMSAVTTVLGIPSARGYANAIAAILYDVHLLGDYSTTNTSALPPLLNERFRNTLSQRNITVTEQR